MYSINSSIAYYGTENLYRFHTWYAQYHGYASVVVCVIGVICNLINIVVLTRRNMLGTTNYILTALAFSDLLTMVPYIPFALQYYCLYGAKVSPQRNTRAWAYFFLFHVNFSVTAHTVSIWLVVVLSVFRYAYVRVSSKGGGRCGTHRARIAILTVYASSIFILIPNYLSMSVEASRHRPTNQTVYDLVQIDADSEYGQLVTNINFWIHALAIKLVPCGLMLIFGMLLICTMRVSHRRRRKLRSNSVWNNNTQSNRRKDHSRTTCMLVVVIVLFLITELPQGVLALCSGLNPAFFDAFYIPLGDVMDIVALINNGINFTLYCSMSRQFRETFLRLFAPCLLPPGKRVLNGTSQVGMVMT